jgi:hypothetical protein
MGLKFCFASFFCLISLSLLIQCSISTPRPRLSPQLEVKLRQNEPTNVILTFFTGTSEILEYISDQIYPDRTTLLFSLVTALDLNSVKSQSSVRSFLSAQSNFSFDPLWVTDQLWIKDATAGLVDSLLADFPEIVEIFEDELTLFSQPTEVGAPFEFKADHGDHGVLAQWGVDKVKGEQAVALLKNVSTSIPTIRVATIDTGVRVGHEALSQSYLGDHGWFDPGMRTEIPNRYHSVTFCNQFGNRICYRIGKFLLPNYQIFITKFLECTKLVKII